jgi:hypothetical protein
MSSSGVIRVAYQRRFGLQEWSVSQIEIELEYKRDAFKLCNC